jgi:phytoene dehydrogenase-like protein
MDRTTVIIIGAGLAGLSAGCFAQMNGYQSRIFEHHAQPGGVAAAWQRGEYLIDGGIHFVMAHKPGTGLHDLYRQLGIVPANRFLDLDTYGRFVHEASGQSLTVTRDLDRLAADLKARFPQDVQLVEELVAGARAMQGLDMSELGMAQPPEMSGLWGQVKELWSMRRLLRLVVGKYGQAVAGYAQRANDPVLRHFLESLFLPQVPVYFVFMLLALLADGQLGLIEGGSREFVRALEQRYRQLGGEVAYRATVDEILVEDDRAVGVCLADGTTHRAGAVISAADGHSTIFGMLGGRYVDAKIRERYTNWPRFAPLVMISYGIAQTFPDQPPFHTIILDQPIPVGEQQVAGLMVRLFNYSPRFAPPGKTVVQVEFETEWDYWNDLQAQDRDRYEAEKERVAAEALARLDKYQPGIASRVEVTDVATPYTTWRYTRNHQGAWEGWLMTPEAVRTAVERTLPGLDDFYMAGQWVMPGGGVPPCLYSGRHAVQLLCRRDGKDFVRT